MVDYSKWKDIEISDDEDDTHPNIDTPSLFRWRHQARVERTQQWEAEKKAVADKKRELSAELEKIQKDVSKAEADEQVEKVRKELADVLNKEEEMINKEKKMKWNVDTIGKDSWSKTVINKPKPRLDRGTLSDDERAKMYSDHVEKHEGDIKKFGLLRKFDDCRAFLLDRPDLVCEETANYLTLWCLNLAIADNYSLMEHVSQQVISMQYILELSKQMDLDPRSCVASFFTRIQKADKEYQDAFKSEITAFRDRIRSRAEARIAEAMKEVEEEERTNRLGPGGLDPVEVFESLPPALQTCFETRDMELLQKTIAEMDETEATHHIKRCIDSGMWIPDKNSAAAAMVRESHAKEAALVAAKASIGDLCHETTAEKSLGLNADEPVYDELTK